VPQQDFDDRYELRQGAPRLTPEGLPDQITLGRIDAMNLGFLEPAPDPETLAKDVQAHIDDHEVTFDVYRKHPVPGSLDEVAPVGTFSGIPKEISWGNGDAANTFAIVGVTVRATDRRRGILRRMMTAALDWAAAEGIPLASLTASEATIYRRFGFGPAIRERTVTIKRNGALPLLAPTSGEVVVVPPAMLREGAARSVFDRFHARTLGSMVRNTGTWGSALGHANTEKEPDRAVRAAIHRDGEDVDGYVTYRFLGDDGKPARVRIVDFIAATEAAYIALWEFLLSIDLVEQVEYPFARVDDPIVHVLSNSRSFDVDHEEDHVWLRILDAVAVLESRPYAADGTLVLTVEDTLGHAAGKYRLIVLEGRGHVERIAPADESVASGITLDVATLGSMLLGAVDPVVLHDVGLVTGSIDDAATLRAMLRPARTPHGMTYF
jgi:predicted acetyltransferase